MKRYALILPMALLLLVAGAVHLFSPETFFVAMPPYLPWHREIILFTGIVEWIAAVGILIPALRKLTGILLAFYFFAIIPAHWHMAVNNVPVFGGSYPSLLWVRLFFQPVLIFWAIQIGRMRC